MQDLIEEPADEGCYIVDRRMRSIEDSVTQLTDCMYSFTQKTRRQRINQRNRVERLSPLLDWKNLGIEYSKARQLALRRAYPDAFTDEDDYDYEGIGMERPPFSVPGSPRFRTGMATPGDLGTLTEEVRVAVIILQKTFINFPTTRFRCKVLIPVTTAERRSGLSQRRKRTRVILCGFLIFSSSVLWLTNLIIHSPLVMKVRSRAGSVMSGASTPGGGAYKSLSERDLQKADAALSHVGEKATVNGRH